MKEPCHGVGARRHQPAEEDPPRPVAQAFNPCGSAADYDDGSVSDVVGES
jgi:hypothetical protein